MPVIAADVGQDRPGLAAGSSLHNAAVCVNPSRETGIGRDQKRLAALHRTKYAAGKVHVEFARSPEPAVIGEIHQHVRLTSLRSQYVDLPPDHLGQYALEADIWGNSQGAMIWCGQIERGRCPARRLAAADRRKPFQPGCDFRKRYVLSKHHQVHFVETGGVPSSRRIESARHEGGRIVEPPPFAGYFRGIHAEQQGGLGFLCQNGHFLPRAIRIFPEL